MTAPPRVVLACDEAGGWTLSEQGAPARPFRDFEAALHCARGTPRTETAPIEVWERGQYVCCLPPGTWPHCRTNRKTVPAPARDGLAIAERCANGVGRFLLSTAGPAFWLVTAAAVLIAGLGWRMVLL